MQDKIHEYMQSHKGEFLERLCRLVAIPSVRGEQMDGAPFGEMPRKALSEMCDIGTEMGYAPEVFRDMVGSIEYCPEGVEAGLGILCHLDVVPAEPNNWTSDPYTLTERDGVLYGRGVIDDKGPAVAALYAIQCVKELGVPLKKGVRFIFGTDEENGSGDMAAYVAEKEIPPYVFTPDGSFPVINIEKGMMRAVFSGDYTDGIIRTLRGGSIPNAVPDKAYAELSTVTLSEVISAVDGDSMFTVSGSDGNVRIDAAGVSAHASTPESGNNAITGLFHLLNKLPLGEKESRVIDGICSLFPHGETDGAHCGFGVSDETGATTVVLSIVSIENRHISGTIDVRFPPKLNCKAVETRLISAMFAAKCELSAFRGDEPHIVPESSDFVQALLRVYERFEGETAHAIAIGGGTYVHNINGGVAFGVERGDTDYHMHAADEFMPTEELLRDAELFAHAILEICG